VNPCTLHWNNAYLRIYRLKRRRFVATCCAAVQINNCLKRTSEIKVATMEITDDFGSHYMPTTKLTLFVESKDEWDTKEGTVKSMKNALHVQQCRKRHLLGWSSEKIKPVALAIVELSESEGIRQAGRQTISQPVSRKFC